MVRLNPLGQMAIAALIAGTLLPSSALACACCAEAGARMEERVELDDWLRAEIATLTSDGTARLYITACGLDCIKGLDTPRDTYALDWTVTDSGVSLSMAEAGEISFAFPETLTWFATDDDLGETINHPGTLHSELRLRGTLAGSGDFAQADGAAAELILIGRGNQCLLPALMDGWMLTVTGETTDFRLFGRFTP